MYWAMRFGLASGAGIIGAMSCPGQLPAPMQPLWHGACTATAFPHAPNEERTMDREQMKELILQSLEHERGGVEVYETAVEAAVNDDLREEWTEYLE